MQLLQIRSRTWEIRETNIRARKKYHLQVKALYLLGTQPVSSLCACVHVGKLLTLALFVGGVRLTDEDENDKEEERP